MYIAFQHLRKAYNKYSWRFNIKRQNIEFIFFTIEVDFLFFNYIWSSQQTVNTRH